MLSYSHPVSEEHVTNKGKTLIFGYPCSNHYECSPYTIVLKKGDYYLEVYGSQGSNSTSHGLVSGGKGGYSAGIFRTYDITTIFLYVGASTNSTISHESSFNGGGAGVNSDDGPGGGATDFRLYEGDLNSRFIVAGGGGGGFSYDSISVQGGDGGGLEGKSGTIFSTSIPCYGTQRGCKGGQGSGAKEGIFGFGANSSHGGGGGGYYGGGNAKSGGSGGSGYIGGVFGNMKYKRQSIAGKNTGCGWAKITIIRILCLTSKKYMNLKSSLLYLTLISRS